MTERKREASLTTQLFAAAGIKRVVFVDDRFGITAERIQSEVDNLSIEQLRDCGAFPGVDFASDNEDIKRGAMTKVIGQASGPDLETMFDKLAAVSHGYDAAERDQTARQYFETVVGVAAETVYLSLQEWEKRKAQLLTEAGATPTLFVFDEDFTLEGQGPKHGRQLIAQMHSANPSYKFVYALLTHNATSDEAELSLQKTISEESPEIAEYILVVAKSRLSEAGDRFAQRMKQLLLFRLFQALKRRLKKETEEASKSALSAIEGLGIESFERIILGTSRVEGAWSPDTFVRVIGVYQQQLIKQNIRKDAELHQFVRDIDPICEVKTPSSEGVTKDAQRLQREELYETGERVNLVHLPIASGDIFKDDGGQEHVLLAQPCDLMVRRTGYRRPGDRDSRQMVPLAPLKKVEAKFGDHPLPSNQYELPHYDAKDRWEVRLNEVYYLPLWLLDLAVLNNDGRCALTEGQAVPPLLISPWIARQPLLVDRAAAVATLDATITDAGVDKIALVQACCRIPLGSPFVAEITRSAEEMPKWTLALKLKRVSRVTEQHATALLIDHAAYTARLAHPHDLTRL